VNFTPTRLAGLFLVTPDRFDDERGSFSRLWAAGDFSAAGLDVRIAQRSISTNRRAGTVRGMHWQAAPHEEVKLVRCPRGAVYDVAVDLRPGSPTWGEWEGFELSPANGAMLYIPAGFAHGFQALADDTEVEYQISAGYAPHAARGCRWDDPKVRVRWPLPVTVISARDAGYPDLP
jgi:dTDP-4-dehydrorhamnose 3,5-epimerase